MSQRIPGATRVRNRRRLERIGAAVLAGTLVLLAVVTARAAAAPDAAVPVVHVAVDRGALTVDVREAPLSEVLRLIGVHAAIEVMLRGDLDAGVTDSFAGVPLEEGIRRLARGHSVTLAYTVSPDEPGRVGVTAVWIVGRTPATDIAAASGPRRGIVTGPLSREVAPSSPVRPPVAEGTEARDDDEGAAAAARLARRTGDIRTLADEADQGSDEAAMRLAEISASEPDARVRQQAVAALGRLKGPTIEPALTAALGDDDAAVRVRAVRGLRVAATDTAVQSLTGVLTGDVDSRVRLAALRALASFPGRATLRELARASSDPDDVVRETAFRGLSWWNTHPTGAR